MSDFDARSLGRLILPLVLLAAALAVFLLSDPMRTLTGNQPPVEELHVQRALMLEDGIELHVINGGPEPVTLAQVMVDEAYWAFAVSPSPRIGRMESVVVHVPYMWVEGELHEIRLVSSTGATFDHTIEVAVPAPTPDARRWLMLAVLGIFIGVIPIALGLMWFPFLHRLPDSAMTFILALTVGLLVYLWFDTVIHGIELASEVPGIFNALPLLFVGMLLSYLALVLTGKRKGVSDRSSPAGRLWIATVIAIGIGLHNLGEGLLVGAAISTGQAALGSFLIIGFVLHNVTEGIGIAAPVAGDKPSLSRFAVFTLVAGGPAVLGTWMGAFAYSPFWAVVFFAVGAGAILQVIVEVGMLLKRRADRAGHGLVDWAGAGGLAAGIAVMYATALLV